MNDSHDRLRSRYQQLLTNPCIIAGIFCWLFAVHYLSGSTSHFFAFAMFLLTFYLPLSTLSKAFFSWQDFPAHLRSILGHTSALIVLIPWFMLRKCLIDYRILFDIASSAGLLYACYHCLKDAHKIDEATPFPSLFWIIQLIVLPLTACLNWTGFEFHFGNKIYYFAEHIVDTGTLSGVVSSIGASPYQPLYPVTGLGTLNYHWLYFTIPAFISDYLGISIRHTNALVLSNLLIGHLLITTIYVSAGTYLSDFRRNKNIQALGPLLVLIASYSYNYYFAFGYKIPPDNHILMPLSYSINYFGNNTLAIVCIISSIMLISEWNQTQKMSRVVTGALLVSIIAGLSATLLFSATLGLALVIITGKVRQPLKFACSGILIGIFSLLCFKSLGLFDGGHAERLAVEFDDWKYVFNIFIAFLPAIAIALFGFSRKNLHSSYAIFIASCLIIPSFLLLENSSYGRIDFSMKISSLIIALMTPFITKGLENLFFERKPVMRLVPIIPIVMGLLLFSVMSTDFLRKRQMIAEAGTIKEKHFAIEEDYFSALDFIRRTSNRFAIVIDPFYEELKDAHVSLMISERRLFLPILKDSIHGKITEEVLQRRQIWNDWKKNLFHDLQTSRYLAKNGNYLVINNDIIDENWEKVFQDGEYQVYQSKVSSN